LSDSPGFRPCPSEGPGAKIQGPLSFGAQNIQGLCPFVPTGVTSPSRPIVKAKATKPLNRPRPGTDAKSRPD